MVPPAKFPRGFPGAKTGLRATGGVDGMFMALPRGALSPRPPAEEGAPGHRDGLSGKRAR